MGDKGEGGIENLIKWVASFMDGPKILLSSNEIPTKIHCPEYQNNSYYLGNTAYNYSLENTHTYYLLLLWH